MSDQEWFSVRESWYGSDGERLKAMERASQMLLTIPGVRRPTSPSELVEAVADRSFRLTNEDGSVDADDLSRLDRSEGPRESTSYAQQALQRQDYALAIHLSCQGRRHLGYWPRATQLLAHALWDAGRKCEGNAAARQLVEAWLDDAAVEPPAVHARRSIERDELVVLIRKTGACEDRIAEVLSAGEVDLPDGDFL